MESSGIGSENALRKRFFEMIFARGVDLEKAKGWALRHRVIIENRKLKNWLLKSSLPRFMK